MMMPEENGFDVPEELADGRRRMLDADLAGRGISDPGVLAAMASVPRHEFVPFPLRIHSYDDTPLGIGCGQTISQPYVVAYMTQALRIAPGMRVLEIGTGSGYQTAVLAFMGAEVFTVERYEELSLAAEARLDRLGLGERTTFRTDDGSLGWPEAAPFDRILAAAAAPRIPAALAEELAEGGLLLLPVGALRGNQRLELAEKRNGRLAVRPLLDVSFVPMLGAGAFKAG
ncbi:MAG: protein-L-isoaspartate(D-aspartate) O-methyltransferase [Planctomycetota bacterium]|jgi:protein-L-isoaspartate(D-aspartate) O-methyltransferase|nr:protein-L-isoaspartate(D-aspartate) O-methyltransferase [Planctomycetota bacterium]